MRIALVCLSLALTIPALATAGPLETGRAKFFSGDFVGADNDFATAIANLPNTDDQEAHAFRSFTRILRVVEEQAAGPNPALRDSLKELLDAFGFPTPGRSILGWSSQPPRDVNGHLVLPANSPRGGEVQSYLAGSPVSAVDAALADLAALSPSFSTVVTGAEIHQLLLAFWLSVSAGGEDVTIGRGEMQLWEAALHALRSELRLAIAYDLDIDLDQVTHVGFVWNLQANVLGPNPNLLDLESNGAAILAASRTDLLAFADVYAAASQTIRGRPPCTPARCFVRIEGADLAREAAFRANLARFRGSVASCTYVTQHTGRFGTLTVNPCPLLGAGPYTAMDLRDLLPPFDYDANASPPSYGNACELPDPTFNGTFPTGSVAPVNLAQGHLRPCGDRWQDAPVAGRGLIRGSLVGTTTDGSSSLGGGPDVWYRYTAAMAETLDLAACGVDGTTILSVHSAGPGSAGNELVAAYEWSISDASADCYAYPAPIAVPLAASQTVWIRVAASFSDSIDGAGFFLRVPEPSGSALGACAVVVLGLVSRRRRT